MKRLIITVLIFYMLLAAAAAAARNVTPQSTVTQDKKFHINMIKGGQSVFNEENEENFNFPYYGVGLFYDLNSSLTVGGRIFSANYLTRFSSHDNRYQHYYWGIGGEVKYSFWEILYTSCTVDGINYSVKSEDANSQVLFFDLPPKNGTGLIGGLHLGLNLTLWDRVEFFAEKYTTMGRVGTTRYNSSNGEYDVDEVFDFTTADNYKFGAGVQF